MRRRALPAAARTLALPAPPALLLLPSPAVARPRWLRQALKRLAKKIQAWEPRFPPMSCC